MSLEYGPKQLKNNSLITTDDIRNETLFCVTDRPSCCSTESNGHWYLPNGTKLAQLTSNTQSLFVSSENQTLGLNLQNVSDHMLSTGIYHCEIFDEKNITNHLYVGIYPQHEGSLNSYCISVIMY